MSKQYIHQIKLRTCQCDMYGGWYPSSILETLQEAAGDHCTTLGLGKPQMDALNLAWVLSRTKVQMNSLPMYGERISIETYASPCRHMFYPRMNILRNEQSEEIGYASSLWVLIDKTTRKLTQSSVVQNRIPDICDLPDRIALPSTVHNIDGTLKVTHTQPRFTDFDLLRHVNNTKYLDFCCEALGHGVMKEHWIKAFDVNYESEVLPGEELRTELVLANQGFVFFGYCGKHRRFAIDGQLEKR